MNENFDNHSTAGYPAVLVALFQTNNPVQRNNHVLARLRLGPFKTKIAKKINKTNQYQCTIPIKTFNLVFKLIKGIYLVVRKSRPDLKDDVSDLSRFTSVARNPFCHPACIDMTLCFVCVLETMIERACRAVPTRKRQDKRDP